MISFTPVVMAGRICINNGIPCCTDGQASRCRLSTLSCRLKRAQLNGSHLLPCVCRR